MVVTGLLLDARCVLTADDVVVVEAESPSEAV